MSNSLQKTNNLVDAKFLTLFRIIFGILMIPQVLSITPSIHELAKSTFVFHYPYLDFIEAYSHELIHQLTTISIIAAGLISIGHFTRIASLVFLLSFGYLFLIDMSFYNNHYYLWCLIAFVFLFIPNTATISLGEFLKGTTKKQTSIAYHVPLALLICIVYFYGGIAKINGDWLQGYPMRLLSLHPSKAVNDFLGYFISYFGLFFDLLMPFLLWKHAQKWFVFLPYIVFHLCNYFLFHIGEFPFLMIASIFLFWPMHSVKVKDLLRLSYTHFTGIKRGALMLFFGFQLLFPLRLYCTEGNPAWHRQGHYFAWRMMLHNYQHSYFQYLVTIPEKNIKYWVDFNKLITYRQYSNAYPDPYFIWKLAQKLDDDAVKKYGISTNGVHVYSKSFVGLNQHKEQDLINQTVDLSATSYHLFAPNSFVTTFRP